MKITKSQLKRIIKEELSAVLSENEKSLRSQAEGDGWKDFKDDGDRGDHWETFEGGKYLTYWQLGFDNAEESGERDDWYDDEEGHETFGDRLWADNPDNPLHKDPDSNEDDAAELAAGLDLSGFELRKIRTGYLIVDKESGVAVLGPFRDKEEAEENRTSIKRNPEYRP